MTTSDEAEIEPPRLPLPTETLVMERGEHGQHQLLWFDGLLLLPIGSRIQLSNYGDPKVPLDPERFPNGIADAIVTDIYLWGTQGSSRCLVLAVELTAAGELGTWMAQR